MKILLYSILFFISVTVNAQTSDSKVKLKPGIYLTIDDYTANSPISPSLIVEMQENKSRKHFHELMEKVEITIKSGDENYKLKTFKIWGFSDGENLFVCSLRFDKNEEKTMKKIEKGKLNLQYVPFFRAWLAGKICLFNHEYTISSGFNQYSGAYEASKSGADDFIIKVDDGKKREVTFPNITEMFVDDPELLKELNETLDERYWSKQEIKTLLYTYVKRYNERNPLY